MTHTLEGREATPAAAMGAIRSSSSTPEARPDWDRLGMSRKVTRPGHPQRSPLPEPCNVQMRPCHRNMPDSRTVSA